MKRIKQVTAILIFVMFGMLAAINNFTSPLDDYNVQTITINNNTLDLKKYNQVVTDALGDDAILLSVHEQNSNVNWYCLGKMCNLRENEYYSLSNDQHAKKVIPVRLTENYRIYPFEKLNNLYTGHISYTFVSKSNNMNEKIKKMESNGLVINISDTKMQAINNNKLLIFIVSLLCMYIISIATEFRKYVLNKFYGKLIIEEIPMLIFQTCILMLLSLVVEIVLLYVLLNNTPLLLNLMPKVALCMIVVAIFIILMNFLACLYVNKYISYKKVTSTISNYINILAYASLIVLLVLSSGNFWQINHALKYIETKQERIPPSELSNYYTYSLRMYGAVDLSYMDKIIDPLHAKFYRKTEDKYDGIIMDFDNYSADYPIVNSNYLDYINYNPKIDSNKLNLLVPPSSGQVTNDNQYNEVKIEEMSFPYINWETGLVEYYSGPLIVANNKATKNVSDQDISVNIQSNNYFLQIDDKQQLTQLQNLIRDLNLDQNMSELYPVTDISSDYKRICIQQFHTYMVYQVIQTILICISLIMYLTYRFKLNETRFIIKYCFGKSSFSIMLYEQLLITIAFLPLLVISPTKYTLMYYLIFQSISAAIITIKLKKIKTKTSSILKQM